MKVRTKTDGMLHHVNRVHKFTRCFRFNIILPHNLGGGVFLRSLQFYIM